MTKFFSCEKNNFQNSWHEWLVIIILPFIYAVNIRLPFLFFCIEALKANFSLLDISCFLFFSQIVSICFHLSQYYFNSLETSLIGFFIALCMYGNSSSFFSLFVSLFMKFFLRKKQKNVLRQQSKGSVKLHLELISMSILLSTTSFSQSVVFP